MKSPFQARPQSSKESVRDEKVPREELVEFATVGLGATKSSAEIALVKKLDWRIMVHSSLPTFSILTDHMQPILWLMFWLNYLDRNAIAVARLNDLEDDLGLVGSGKCLGMLIQPDTNDEKQSTRHVFPSYLSGM